MSTLETNLIQPSTGTTLTLGASGDTVDVPSGATLDVTGATVTGLTTGKFLQIQNMSTTGESSTSGSSFIDTGLTDTITCSSSSSKVLIFPSFPHRTSNTSGNAIVTVERAISGGATTVLSSGSLGFAHTYETNFTMTSFFVLDEPNTSSEITYTIQLKSDNASATVYVGRSNATSQLFLFEIGA